jgi:glyoxylase-like metal-dependent hydrolase (beta-lactamase superfamily II)
VNAKIETIVVSPFATNCYVFSCTETREAAVIDPGDSGEAIARTVQDAGLSVRHILLTHGHTDHVAGVPELQKATGARIYLHAADLPLLREAPRMGLVFGWSVGEVPEPDVTLEEGDEVTVGKATLRVLHTPGHSPGGVCFAGDGFVFAGDTLFAGSIGRTDLPGGSGKLLLEMIREKILTLPEETQVLTGHGPATTVAEERRSNPFLGDGFIFP